MSAPDHNLDVLLARVADGQLDDLTPSQIAALEAHLNATPAATQRLANVVPTPDARLGVGASLPTTAEWEDVWEGIESATLSREPAPRTSRRAMRLWQPLAAAAACLLLTFLWHVGWPTESTWEIQLSEDVVVHELEVFGDSSAFVSYPGDESGTAVIWVFEEEQELQGV